MIFVFLSANDRFESESSYSAFTFKQSGALSKCYKSVKMPNVKVICWAFEPCHYHTNVCKISRLCKAISSLSLEVLSLNLVSYCKLPLLSPELIKLRRGFRRVDKGGGGGGGGKLVSWGTYNRTEKSVSKQATQQWWSNVVKIRIHFNTSYRGAYCVYR